eukprot:scaffold8984_cov14-Tisochrysis_lutea.AAC.1
MKPLPVQDGLILRSYFKTVWHQDPGAQHVAYCGPKNLLPQGFIMGEHIKSGSVEQQQVRQQQQQQCQRSV